MGWIPSLHFDKSRRRFYCRMHGELFRLGSDHAEAQLRFGVLFKQHYGDRPRAATPRTVPQLVAAWLVEHPGDWHRDSVKLFSTFSLGQRLEDLKADVLCRYAKWLEKRGYDRWKGRGKRKQKVHHEYAPQTIAHYVEHARRVLEWGTTLGLIRITIDRPKLAAAEIDPKDLTMKRVELTASSLGGKRQKWARDIFEFIIETGCRPGEARRLTWDMVDIDGGVCKLSRKQHKTGKKTGRSRTIYLTPAAIALLRDVRGRSSGEGAVFKSRLNRPYTSSGLRSVLSRAGTVPNHLRHTFAQRYLDNGGDLAVLAGLLGHTDLRMVKRYAQIRDQRLLRAAADLPGVVPECRRVRLVPVSASAADRPTETASPRSRAG